MYVFARNEPAESAYLCFYYIPSKQIMHFKSLFQHENVKRM